MASVCHQCGSFCPEGAHFCGNCGTSLEQLRKCTHCGAGIQPGSKFCAQCGTPNAETASPSSNGLDINAKLELLQPAPHKHQGERGEQREVTVLFLDIVNFTGVSHRLESEDVYHFINEAMKIFVEVLQKYNGTVDKFTGDGLMALFGAPMAHENDPELAVRAGLEMLERLTPLQESVQATHDFLLQARIGIHTGFAIAGHLGSSIHQEYTVIGDTVNLASRLESASQPGTVLVSEETYRRTRALFHYIPVNDLQLKGYSEPLTGYRPLRLRRTPGRVRGLVGITTPIIGRGDELIQLDNSLNKMLESQQGQMVLVTGEAGLGKSRLVMEFRKQITARAIPSYFGTSYPHTRSVPYSAVARLLQDIFQIAENDTPEVQYASLLTQISALEEADLHGLPFLLNILGLERFDLAAQEQIHQLDPQMLQRQTFVAMRRLLAAEVREKPLVLIMDDLHWIDAASREMLLYLLRAVSDLPILFIMISRPVDAKSPAHSLLAEVDKSSERVTTIQLKALSLDRIKDILRHIITATDEKSREIIESVATRAEGIPYYAEELVRMLIDKKVLIEDDQQGYQATEEAEDVLANVPGTLTGLLMARFDTLDELSHQVLQKAVVLGRSFPVPLLQELCQVPLTTLLPILEELENRLFLRPEEFGHQQGYSFGHTLVRSTIHNTLLRRTRRQLHQQVAEVIEQKNFYSDEDRIEALGYHYSESDIPHKAIPYLVLSAENAFVRGAHETALNSYRRCLAVAPSQEMDVQEEYSRIRLGMGRTLKFLGDLNEALQRLQEAVDNLEQNRATTPEELTTLIEALTELGDAYLRAGQSDEAWKQLNAAQVRLQNAAALTTAGASRLWTALLDRMAWARLRQGDLNEAISLAQEALDGSETIHNKNPGLLASLYNILGGVYYQKGIPARAVQYVRMSLNLYESLDYSWGVASALSNLGVLYYAQGLWSEAAEYYERAEMIRREHGFAAERALNLYNLALLRSTMGMHSQAIEIFESCLVISQRLGDHKVIGCCYIGLGQLAEIEERVEDLDDYVEKASAYINALGDDHKTHLCLLQAQLEKHLGHFESAIEIATSALDLAEKAGLSEEIVDTHRVLGTLYRAAGDYTHAEKALRYSLQISQERSDPHHQGLAELELAQLLADIPDTHQRPPEERCRLGRDMLVRAAGHFEQVGAIYFLGVAQALLNRSHTSLVPSAYIDA